MSAPPHDSQFPVLVDKDGNREEWVLFAGDSASPTVITRDSRAFLLSALDGAYYEVQARSAYAKRSETCWRRDGAS